MMKSLRPLVILLLVTAGLAWASAQESAAAEQPAAPEKLSLDPEHRHMLYSVVLWIFQII